MSSPQRNAFPIKQGAKQIPQPTGWKCPDCGEKALRRVKKSYRLEEDGVVMPKLERLQCQACQANFFDAYALDQITEFRKRHPLKKATIKQLRKAVAA
jgi:hypothetical protein